MKKFLFMTALLISSCTAVKFETPYPVNAVAVSEFPEKIWGTFITSEDDTLTIDQSSFKFSSGKEFNLTGALDPSGDVILKKQNHDYYLNLKDDQGWDVIPLKISRNKIKARYADLNSKTEPLIQDLGKTTTVKKIHDEDGKFNHYLIAPSKEQFEMLLQKKLFSNKIVFKRIK